MLLRPRARPTAGASADLSSTVIDGGIRKYARSFAAPLLGLAAMLMLLLGFAAASAAEVTRAEDGDRRLGEHPAVIIQRLHARQGFDYEGSFYPHPAWLFLSSEAPRPMMDHPAVIVFRRNQDEAARLAMSAPQALRDATGG